MHKMCVVGQSLAPITMHTELSFVDTYMYKYAFCLLTDMVQPRETEQKQEEHKEVSGGNTRESDFNS